MNVAIMTYFFMGGGLCFVFVLIWHIKSAEKVGLSELNSGDCNGSAEMLKRSYGRISVNMRGSESMRMSKQ